MEELILGKARELFCSYGLRNVSMDDLARTAGISKKTIYQSFSDKNELVDRVVEALVAQHHRLFQESRQQALDPVDEVLRQSTAPFQTWACVSPNFFHELERFFPLSWERLDRHRLQVLTPGITDNLERGIDTGLYREELDASLVADIRIQQLTSALQSRPVAERQLGPQKLMQEYTRFYLHGITTEKGKKLVHKYSKNRNEHS